MWVGGRCCWAQLWMVKAAAVASRLVISERDDETRREGESGGRPPERQGNDHDERGEADLERGKLAGWELREQVWARMRR